MDNAPTGHFRYRGINPSPVLFGAMALGILSVIAGIATSMSWHGADRNILRGIAVASLGFSMCSVLMVFVQEKRVQSSRQAVAQALQQAREYLKARSRSIDLHDAGVELRNLNDYVLNGRGELARDRCDRIIQLVQNVMNGHENMSSDRKLRLQHLVQALRNLETALSAEIKLEYRVLLGTELLGRITAGRDAVSELISLDRQALLDMSP